MATPGKAQLLTEVHTLLKRRYKLEPRAARLSVLEAVIYGICHEGVTREQANQSMSRFKDDFFDWNEVRVSSVDEIRGVLADLPDAEDRAFRLRRFLRQLFEKTYGFTLEPLTKKPLKEAVKALQEYDAFSSDYVLATVVQQALGGHAVPVDRPMIRALSRLGLADPEADPVALRASLERAVPKNRGNEFVDLIEELTHDTCVEGEPDCPRCDLRKLCPTGQARLASEKQVAKAEAAAARSAAHAAAKAAKAPKAAEAPRPAPALATNKAKAPVVSKPTAHAAGKPSKGKPPRAK